MTYVYGEFEWDVAVPWPHRRQTWVYRWGMGLGRRAFCTIVGGAGDGGLYMLYGVESESGDKIVGVGWAGGAG